MADLAGTVVGVVAFGLQLATTLQTFTELVIEAQDALRDLVFEVNATAAALRQLQTIVDADRAFPDAQKTSRVFNDSGLREIQTLAAKCEKVYRAIVRLVLKASSSAGGSDADAKGSLVAIDASALKPLNILRRLRWPWLIPRIGRCQEQLRWLKVSLLVTLQLANLAAQQIRHEEPVSPEDHVMAREAIDKLRKRQGQLAPRRPLGHGKPEVIDHGEARAVLSTSAATHVQPYAPRDIMSKALVTGRRFAPDRGVGGHGSTSQPTDPDRAKGFNSSASLPCSVEASPYLQPVQEPDQTLGTDPRQNPYHLQRGGCGSKHGREPSLDHPLPATLALHTSAVKRALVLTDPMRDANKQEQVPRDLLINAESPAEHTRRANPPLQPPPGMLRSRGNGRLHTLRNIGNDDPSDHLQAIIIEHGDIRLMPFSQESLEQNLRQTLETQSQSLWEQFLHVDAGTQGLLVKGTDWARTATNRDATLVAFHRLQRPSGPDAMVALLLLKESLEPMQLVDEAGRTFTVPYGAYHSYEKFHATMLNLLGDDEVLIAAVREGAFQLQNEKGETIHPTLWASCIRPGAAVAIAKTRRRFLVKSDASKRLSSPQAEALSTGEPRPVTPAWKAALLKRTNGGRRTSPLDQTASQADGILPTPISTFAGSPPRPRVRRRRRILSRLRSSIGALRSELLNMKVWTSSRSSESSGSSGSSGSCRVSKPGMMWVRRKRTRPSARFHHACISGSQNLAPPARRRHSSALRTPLAHRLPLSGLSVRPDRVFDTTGKTYGYDSECINSSARYANRFEGLEDEEQLLSSSDDESEDVSLGEEADVGSWSIDELLSRWTNARGNPPLEEGVAKDIVH